MLAMKKTSLKSLAVAALTIFGATSSFASMLGDAVHAEYRFPDELTVNQNGGTAVVTSAGVDLPVSIFFTLHVTDTQIIADNFSFVSYWTPASFNGFQITNLTKSFDGTFSVNAATNMAGFSGGNVSVIGNLLSVNWQSLSFNPSTKVVLDLTPAVPESETYVLALAGGLVVGVMRRRKLK